jgi:hypothetical protein
MVAIPHQVDKRRSNPNPHRRNLKMEANLKKA